MAYSIVNVDELQGEGPGGAVRFVRRALGATAFGINHFTLAPGTTGHEHDEAASRQEEVLVVLSGSGSLAVDGDDVPLRVGSIVRVDPESVRVPTAGPDGLAFVAIGAPRADPYVAHGPF